MLNRDSEFVICSRFVNCELWSCDMNSTLGSVVPLAMFNDRERSSSAIFQNVEKKKAWEYFKVENLFKLVQVHFLL